jgi:hypothetical protein
MPRKFPHNLRSSYAGGPGWLFFSALGQLQDLTLHLKKQPGGKKKYLAGRAGIYFRKHFSLR